MSVTDIYSDEKVEQKKQSAYPLSRTDFYYHAIKPAALFWAGLCIVDYAMGNTVPEVLQQTCEAAGQIISSPLVNHPYTTMQYLGSGLQNTGWLLGQGAYYASELTVSLPQQLLTELGTQFKSSVLGIAPNLDAKLMGPLSWQGATLGTLLFYTPAATNFVSDRLKWLTGKNYGPITSEDDNPFTRVNSSILYWAGGIALMTASFYCDPTVDASIKWFTDIVANPFSSDPAKYATFTQGFSQLAGVLAGGFIMNMGRYRFMDQLWRGSSADDRPFKPQIYQKEYWTSSYANFFGKNRATTEAEEISKLVPKCASHVSQPGRKLGPTGIPQSPRVSQNTPPNWWQRFRGSP